MALYQVNILVGRVMHNNQLFDIQLWSEQIYIKRVENKSKAITYSKGCLISEYFITYGHGGHSPYPEKFYSW